MGSKQRFIFLSTVLVIAAMGVCPPWKEAGPKGLPLAMAPIYAPPIPKNPENGLEIDFARLFLQASIVMILSGGIQMAFQDKKERKDSASSLVNQFNQFKQAADALNQVTVVPPAAKEAPSPADMKDVIIHPAAFKDVAATDFDILELPAHLAIGEFLVESESDPDSWEWLADAKGTIKVPKGKSIQLEVAKEQDVDFALLKRIPPQVLDSMDLSQTKVRDEDLANVKRFTRLKEIDLSDTNVTNKALEHLSSMKSLRKIWLDNTHVDDEALASLAELSKLQKLSLKDCNVT
ncbi:MAG: hypothetical protein SFY67_13020, partial [Candidatus Melainabacteria bacterium]|nr:hypothetical protein [Candidatus Melainabacteria bacterium]